MIKEVERIQRQRVIEQVLPPSGHASYAAQAKVLRDAISIRTTSELLKLLQENTSNLDNS